MKAFTRFGRSLLAPMAGGLLVFIGCVTPGGSSTAADTSMMQAFHEYKAAWNSHDVQALMAFYGQQGTLNNPGTGKMPPQATARWLQGLFTAIPDFKVKVISADPIGNHMLAEQWVISGTWEKPFPDGPLAGKKPTGKSFTVPGATFLKWHGDKIVSDTQYFDQMAFLTQIGVIPPPGQKPQASAK
jgi:predicted ester cyclase